MADGAIIYSCSLERRQTLRLFPFCVAPYLSVLIRTTPYRANIERKRAASLHRYCCRLQAGVTFTGSCSLEGRQTLRLFLPSNSPPFARAFPVTKRYSGRDFPTKVTPSTSWGGRQTGFAGRQAASPYGSPGRPFHCTCRLLLARWLILATIVASAFTLPCGQSLAKSSVVNSVEYGRTLPRCRLDLASTLPHNAK